MVRKTTFYLASISLILTCGCTHETLHNTTKTNQSNIESSAEWIPQNTKSNPILGIKTRIGHDISECDGSCSNDNKHMDCQGRGSKCSLVSQWEIVPIFPKNESSRKSVYTGHCLYKEDMSDNETFSMPARSFYMEQEQTWINVPEQTLFRNPQNQCFIIKNITFTIQPLYTNL